MAWTDRPTEAQMGALWSWFQWEMPRAEAKDALDWLQKNATRKQVSNEMTRVRDLLHAKKLNREECFRGEVWAEYFNAKAGKEPTDK